MTEEELRAIFKGCRERYPDLDCRGCPNYADVELVQHEQSQADLISKLEAELEQVKWERDAAVNDIQEIMALTSEMRVCTKYCVNGHCYNRGGNMPCNPRWDALWSGHEMEE